MTSGEVSTRNDRFRRSAVLEASAEGLALVQGAATNLATADDLDWSESTVKAVRARSNGLTLELAWKAAWHTQGRFLGPLLAMLGLRAVPLNATCTTDAGVQTSLMRLGVKLAMAMDPSSHGGPVTTAREAKGMMPEIDLFQAHLDRLRALAVGA